MERAGGALEDDALREALRGAGLGTPATRADTIETLIRREYIERKGKTVVATSLGTQVIDALAAFPHLTDARLTGRWESMLTRVADGEYPAGAFMEKVEQMTRAIVAHFTAHPPRIKGKEREVLGACPACHTRQVLVSKKGAWCQGLREKECDFVIGRVLAKKTLTVPQLKRLLAHGSHPGVKGFTSKAGKKFDAPLKLERREAQDGWRVAFDFPERAPREDLSGAPVVGTCPKCGGQVALGSRSARCTAPGCDVSLWRTVCGKELGAEVLTQLLRERATPELSGFVSKKNKRFATALVLVKDPKRGWKIGFPERAPRSTGKTKAKKTSSKATTP
jgi:DNA topoisomerase-3